MKSTFPETKALRDIFNSISDRYDLLNQILSFNAADRWRRRAKEILAGKGLSAGAAVLDLGVGTGDFLKWFLNAHPWTCAAGLDFSTAMLKRAREKLPPGVALVNADFQELPFREACFDLVISAFTLRSIQDMPQFLKGLYGIVKPEGTVAFLDLTRPGFFRHKLFFYPYLKCFLPLVGGLISGNFRAYQFLSASVANFQVPSKTIALMEAAGFKDCCSKSFSFGTVTLIIGRKKGPEPSVQGVQGLRRS